MRRYRNLIIAVTFYSLTNMSALFAQNETTISLEKQEKIEKIFNFLTTHPTQKGRQPPIYQQRLINEVDKYLQTNLVKFTTPEELKQFIAYMRHNNYVYDPGDAAKKMAYKLAQEQYTAMRYNHVKQLATEAAYIAFVEEFRGSGSSQLDDVSTLLALSRIRRALDAADYNGAARLVKARIQAVGDTSRVLREVDPLAARKIEGSRDAVFVNAIIGFMEASGTRTEQMPSLDTARVQYEQIKFDGAKSKKTEAAMIAFIDEFKTYKSSQAAAFLRLARDQLGLLGTARVIAEGAEAMRAAIESRTPDYLHFQEIYETIADARYRNILTAGIDEYDAFLVTYQNRQEAMNGSEKIRSLVNGIVLARQRAATALANARAAAQLAFERALLAEKLAGVRTPGTGLLPGEVKRLEQQSFDLRYAAPAIDPVALP